ncbi:MAG: ATP-binding protein [Clostridiales bacterium]|nr:ATP-binding protein [Clostridiales bacterium]
MKKKLTAGTMLIVILALLISGTAGVWSLHRQEMESARQSLHELLDLVDAQSQTTDPEHAMKVFLAAAPEKRLTIIDASGRVVADSESDTTENHLDRPEVQAALASGWGEATRSSETVGVPLLYVAKAFTDGMVGRAAMPLSSIDSLVMEGLPPLILSALIALILAFLLSGRMARQLLEPLGVVSSSLQGVLEGSSSAGELKEYEADDELRPILRYIEKLIARLGEYLDRVKSERDKVNLILECMDEGLILLDEQDNILAINRSARELFGIPEGAENGGVQVLIRSRKVRQALETTRRDKTPVVLDLQEPALGSREVRLFLSPVSERQYEGKPVGTSLLISDVTELKRAEGIRSQFTANVSHELKTPLTSIKGFTDMLASGMVKSEEDQKRFLTMIGVEVDRLIELINDILKLSELESVAIDQSDETASPLEAANEAAKLLEPKAVQAGVALSVSGEAGLARISAGRLKELLINLIENAVKYSRESGGKVDVSVRRSGSEMIIAVSDNGIGIPEEAQSRVFERFYRVDKGRSRQTGGTGLGLAIVKHICQLYSGSVSLTSEVGKGSTFTVTLPAAEEE